MVGCRDAVYSRRGAVYSRSVQFELTPKALANFSPGLELGDNPGNPASFNRNAEGVG
jgi:hypothetical protein